MSLIELEHRMDEVIARQIGRDIDKIDTAFFAQMREEFASRDHSVLDNIMVEIYDARILRSNSPEGAAIGKMSVSSAVRKFQ